MENLYCAMNHTRAINFIHYIYHMYVGTPPFIVVVAKMDIILNKMKALKLGKLENQFDPTLISCNLIQAIYIVHLQQ